MYGAHNLGAPSLRPHLLPEAQIQSALGTKEIFSYCCQLVNKLRGRMGLFLFEDPPYHQHRVSTGRFWRITEPEGTLGLYRPPPSRTGEGTGGQSTGVNHLEPALQLWWGPLNRSSYSLAVGASELSGMEHSRAPPTCYSADIPLTEKAAV